MMLQDPPALFTLATVAATAAPSQSIVPPQPSPPPAAATPPSTVPPQPSSPPAAPTPSTVSPQPRQYKFETSFDKGRNSTVTLIPSKGRYVIRLSRKFSPGRSLSINFSKNLPFGLSSVFGEFVASTFQKVVSSWTSVQSVTEFYNDRDRWKKKVMTEYKDQCDRASAITATGKRKRGCYDYMEKSLVFKGKKSVHDIRVPFFNQMRTGKTKANEVQCIRILAREHKLTRNKPTAYVYIPGVMLIGTEKAKEVTLGAKYGLHSGWLTFVAEYLQYAVSKWQSFEDLSKWCNEHCKDFIQLLQKLWEHRGGNKGTEKFWSIRPSKLPVDEQYVKEGWFPAWAANDRGFGLWCNKTGKYPIPYDAIKDITAPSRRMTHQQGYYGAVIDSEKGVHMVPSMQCFVTCAIHHTFLVGHFRDDGKDRRPTHELSLKDGIPTLLPIRVSNKGEEFCFDYGYHNPGVKDVPTFHV